MQLNNNTLKIVCWNVEGLCGQDVDTKEFITYRLGADVCFYSETWAKPDQPVDLEGYICINKCRNVQHVRANPQRGEIVFLIKNELADIYNIHAVDTGMDEVLFVKLTDKLSGFAISLFGLYIPPETSSFGQDTDLV